MSNQIHAFWFEIDEISKWDVTTFVKEMSTSLDLMYLLNKYTVYVWRPKEGNFAKYGVHIWGSYVETWHVNNIQADRLNDAYCTQNEHKDKWKLVPLCAIIFLPDSTSLLPRTRTGVVILQAGLAIKEALLFYFIFLLSLFYLINGSEARWVPSRVADALSFKGYTSLWSWISLKSAYFWIRGHYSYKKYVSCCWFNHQNLLTLDFFDPVSFKQRSALILKKMAVFWLRA